MTLGPVTLGLICFFCSEEDELDIGEREFRVYVYLCVCVWVVSIT